MGSGGITIELLLYRGWWVLWYFRVYLGLAHFWFDFLNLIFLGDFRKNECFLAYEDFMDIFFFLGGGGHRKAGLFLEVISVHFVQNGNIF